jgi:type II secretory pathway pseudopilin PulG
MGVFGVLILVTVNAGMRLYPLWQERQTREKIHRVQQDMRVLAAALEAYQADLISRTASNPLPGVSEKDDVSTTSSLPQLGKYAYEPTNGTMMDIDTHFCPR